jgi:mevalonate kinase
MISASAPAKIILFGEHAVVYGQPAIAAPVSSLRATATAETSEADFSINAGDKNFTLPSIVDSAAVDDALAQTARLVLERLNVPPPKLRITLTSDIPIASGLGSGAAVSAALARALGFALGEVLENDELNALVYEVETLHHGTPSGIDNTVIVYEQPIFFVRGQPIQFLRIGAPLHLLIADTGQGALTRVSVGAVRERYEADPEAVGTTLEEIGALAREARAAIERGDPPALGALMPRNHTLLRDLTVSSPELDRLVDAAMNAGALGAKLSGGGRGGNMIALVTPDTAETVRAALLAAGAVNVIETQVR